MTAVLVTFMIVLAQWGANGAICGDLTFTESHKNSLVLAGETGPTCCDVSQCAPLCQLTSQEKPFSFPQYTYKRLLNSVRIAPVLNRLGVEGLLPTHFLWPAAAQERHKPGLEVYLLNASFLI